MSNGGGESSRGCAQHSGQRKPGLDDFPRALLKIAVAQICESEGFQSFQQSALETLSDVVARYIVSIGKIAHFNANVADRTECHVFDIIQGLEDLASPQGFLGASDVDHCLASSGTVREIIQYVSEVGKLPFVYSIPKFPIVKERKPAPSFLALGEEPPGEHMPSWLPAFPDIKTYTQLPMQSEREPNLFRQKIEHARQPRKAEQALSSLQQLAPCNGLKGPSVDPGDASRAMRTAETNPFLVPPLPFGEKEVSPIVLPAKFLNEAAEGKNVAEIRGVDCPVSLLEPSVVATKRSSCEYDGKKVLSDQRTAVQFKIGMGKKTSGVAFAGRLQDSGVEDITLWFTKDGEKDDKKRTEKLLKESMSNPEEGAEL